jgi:allene oxide cyclase
MAVSIQVSSVSSRVQGIPQISAAGAGSENLLRSQFLGSGRICIPSGARKNGVVSHNVVRAGTVRSASIFETLGKFFSSSYEDEEQVLQVYEINDLTGYSPAKLDLAPSKGTFPTLGDFVPYTNKVYDASGKKCLGFSAGLCVCIRNGSGTTTGDFYETTYTHYLGDLGHLSAMGPYYTTSNSEMVVTGGTGIFKGARGTVTLHSVQPPLQILYTYNIKGIQKLPAALTIALEPVEPLKIPTAPVPATAST